MAILNNFYVFLSYIDIRAVVKQVYETSVNIGLVISAKNKVFNFLSQFSFIEQYIFVLQYILVS